MFKKLWNKVFGIETPKEDPVTELYNICEMLCHQFLTAPQSTIFVRSLRDYHQEVPQNETVLNVINSTLTATNKRVAVYDAMMFFNDISPYELNRIKHFPKVQNDLNDFLYHNKPPA